VGTAGKGEPMKKGLLRWGGVFLFLIFIWISFRFFDLDYTIEKSTLLFSQPLWLLAMTIGYTCAFLCRAWAWKWYVSKQVPLLTYLHALFYSLFVNHLLPIKAGDVIRVGVLMKEKEISWDESLHSVIVMRSLDLLVLGLLAGLGSLLVGFSISWNYSIILLLLTGMAGALAFIWIRRRNLSFFSKHLSIMKLAFSTRKGIWIGALILLSWLLEAVVVLGVSHAINVPISVWQSIWVNSMTIAGQVFHFTPGGIGSYESVMSFSLAGVGISWSDAYIIAIMSHGFKFIFSYIVGVYVLIKAPVRLGEVRQWISKKGERVSKS
jgi:uncharacterized membrane protein YbhN (UPF0104 family)